MACPCRHLLPGKGGQIVAAGILQVLALVRRLEEMIGSNTGQLDLDLRPSLYCKLAFWPELQASSIRPTSSPTFSQLVQSRHFQMLSTTYNLTVDLYSSPLLSIR